MPRLKNAAGTVVEVDDDLAERMKGHGWSAAGRAGTSDAGTAAKASTSSDEEQQERARSEDSGGATRRRSGRKPTS